MSVQKGSGIGESFDADRKRSDVPFSADASLTVTDKFVGKMAETTYFGNYERLPLAWKLAAGEVDGEPVVGILERALDTWTPCSIIRLSVLGQHISRIDDYVHCPWIISTAESVTVTTPS